MLTLLVGISLCGCGVAPPPGARYHGHLEGCGAASATLTRQGGRIAFAPADGVLVLRGAVAADGVGFAASLNTQPAGKPPYLLSVSGRFAATTAQVEFVTPRCRVSGMLTSMD
jgi:hypothetical protein